MATLTDADYTTIRQKAWADPEWKAIFKAMPLSKDDFKTLFQDLETWMVGAFLTTPTEGIKAKLAETYPSITNAQGIAVFEVWVSWRFEQ